MKKQTLAIMMVSFVMLSAIGVMAFDRTTNEEFKEVLKNLKETESLQDSEKVEASIKEYLPDTKEAADKKVQLAEKVNRFILWTSDGENVMWGTYGNNYFTGEDNNGKETWGIYQKGFFAGFYDGEFFYGRYNGFKWKTHGLFEEEAQGGLAVFPRPFIRPNNIDRPDINSIDKTALKDRLGTKNLQRQNLLNKDN